MATIYKIHPAIGVARVGNSPDDFFIGPERIGEEPNPPGGFKDPQCRVKRQAARFRIFAHHDNGTVEEITDADAEISWTVHLANKKAAHPGRGNSEAATDLTIDPGPRTLTGPDQRLLFDTGTIHFDSSSVTTVPLGEIRSDDANHLLVLGGAGNAASPPGNALSGYFWSTEGWFDDIADGPVSATITLRADNSTPAVVGAWVIVAPPKFAPHQDSVITLYERVRQTMIDAGLLPAPTTTSYTNDVYPILQRARDTKWVTQTFGAHAWPDPVTDDGMRNAIFSRLKAPDGSGGNMPRVYDSGTGDDSLTPTQYAHMQRWKDNNYTNDWAGAPPPQVDITADGLDRAALEAGVGGAFYPGIEAGGLPGDRPIIDAALYTEAFRLNHATVTPGAISYTMALPWQNDFFQCRGGSESWWPVPRPDFVTRGGTAEQPWAAGIVDSAVDMVDKWHKLGFVVRQGAQHVEVSRCGTASIQLLTTLLNFQDVPQGPLGMVREAALAIVFEVISPSSAVTLEYSPGGAPGHPQLTAFNTSVTVGPTSGSSIATARLWLVYRTSNPGDVLPPQTLTVREAGGTQSWTVTVIGNTVARKTAAAALVLDRSLSMADDRGDGESKHTSLQQAASIFVDVMLEGDGVGVVRFNEDAQVLENVVTLGSGGLADVNRQNTIDFINGSGLDPAGNTSIGDGIFEGRGILNSAGSFDVKALVVLTDGIENRSRYIADVAAEINEFTYGIGLGQPQNISVPALQTISGNNGGYLLVTGAIGTDNRFLLQKYFLQILAGISNAEIVLDPDGQLLPGRVERIPFQLTSGDAGVDVILLSPYTKVIDFRLQTPSGQIIEPWRALSEPGMRYVLANGVTYYRLALPTELVADTLDGGGTWHALLTIGRPRTQPSGTIDGADNTILRGLTRAPQRSRIAAPLRGQIAQRAAMLHAEQSIAAVAPAAATSQRTLPYSLIVHAYSNLSLQAHTEQDGFAPGAHVELHASLAQSGVPLAQHAQVWAELIAPNGAASVLSLTEASDGQYTAHFIATAPGVYRLRIRARGTNMRNEPFSREKTLTAAVWRGGDSSGDPTNPGNNGGHVIVDYLRDRDARLCELLKCFLQRDGVINAELEKRLREAGINLDVARKCLSGFCEGEYHCDGGRG